VRCNSFVSCKNKVLVLVLVVFRCYTVLAVTGLPLKTLRTGDSLRRFVFRRERCKCCSLYFVLTRAMEVPSFLFNFLVEFLPRKEEV
jgi:hypothetical protein